MTGTAARDRLSGLMSQNAQGTSADKVYAALRADIVAGRAAPGAVLSRAELASRFDVSQTPVREALLRLEQDGMIEVRAQSKTRVAPIRVIAVHQAMFLRRALECEVVRKLASDPERRQLEKVEASLEADDMAFHRALFEAVGMEDVLDRLAPILVPLERYVALAGVNGSDATAEHGDILDRIRSRDPDGAALAMKAHLASETEVLSELQHSKPDWFVTD